MPKTSHSGVLDWALDVLKIPRRLLDSMVQDDDWTFIIKLHGMLEASLNHLILDHVGIPELETFVANLETANTSTGKIAFAAACDLISKDERAFIRALATVRNKAVHNILNFDLNLREYVAGLTGQFASDWKKGMGVGAFNLPILGNLPAEEFAEQNPRIAALSSCLALMKTVWMHTSRAPSDIIGSKSKSSR